MYVALVDTDRMVVQLVQKYLDDAGHVVVEVDPNTQQDWADSADLFIVDLNQRLTSGKTVYERIRSLPKHSMTPCLLISGRITVQHVQSTKNDPAVSLLIKPFTKEVFDDALRRCLKNAMAQSSKLYSSVPTSALPPDETNALFQSWQQDVAALEKHMHSVKERLRINPRQEFEDKVRQLHANPNREAINLKDLKRSIMDAVILKSVFILVQDEATKKIVVDHFRQKEIFELQIFDDGHEAWEKLQEEQPDLFIMEWHNENLGGLALYNRIRELANTSRMPILAITGPKESMLTLSLCEQDCVLKHIEKPVQISGLEKKVNDLVCIAHCATDLERTVRNTLRHPCAAGILKNLVDDLTEKLPGLQMHIFTTLNQLIEDNEFEMAETLGRLLLDKPEFLIASAIALAKIYHLTQRSKAAAEVLAYATALSPHRLDHLLLAAEVEIALLHPQIADRYIKRASTLDATHPRVEAAAFISSCVASQSNLMPDSPASRNFASILNTVGVTLAKSGRTSDAERYYLSALIFVRDRTDKARLHYNLGLRYLRVQDQEKALLEFLKADRLADGNFAKASAQIHEQLKKKTS